VDGFQEEKKKKELFVQLISCRIHTKNTNALYVVIMYNHHVMTYEGRRRRTKNQKLSSKKKKNEKKGRKKEEEKTKIEENRTKCALLRGGTVIFWKYEWSNNVSLMSCCPLFTAQPNIFTWNKDQLNILFFCK
jgi:hypothetical protein